MIIRGDARRIPLADESVQTVVTSPPYWGLRDYGICGQIGLEPTPDAYVATMVEVFREVKRVLRADGTVWLNLGDSYAGTLVGQPWGLENCPKQQSNAGSQFNDDHVRGRLEYGLKPKNLCGIPWRVTLALQADGWTLRSDIIWAKPNPMPESVTDRPTRSHEYLFLFAKSERYFYDAEAIREPSSDDSHGSPRVNPGIKSDAGGFTTNGHGASSLGKWTASDAQKGRNKRDVWTVNSEPTPEAHFATFPQKLIEPCILAGSRTGDLVFDPFFGSGTVGKVAERFGRRWIGLELNPAYIGIAKRNTAQLGLWNNAVIVEFK